MTVNKLYSAQLASRMAPLFEAGNGDATDAFLRTLSNAEFRRAGYMAAHYVLPALDEDCYWQVFLHLLAADARAWLGTLLIAARERVRQGCPFSLAHPGFRAVAGYLNDNDRTVDKDKMLHSLLPLLQTADEMTFLFDVLKIDQPRRHLDYLLRCSSLPAYYLLFQVFRRFEHDKDLLTRCCAFLMKKGDSLSFNLASVSKAYFDLPRLCGTFSLRLQPYELSGLEGTYDAFVKILGRM